MSDRRHHLIRLERNALFSRGASTPTRLELRAVDDHGNTHVLVFHQRAFEKLAVLLLSLAKAFPDDVPGEVS